MAKVDAGPGRGMRVVDGRLFSVVGSKLYQITTSGVAVPYGTVPGVGRVSMAHNQRGNGNELAIDNGSARYVYNTQTQVIQKVTDTSFPGSFKAFFADGYIGYIEPFGRYWGHSDLGNATNYQSFDVYEAEGQPDRIVSANVLMREVQIFGQETTELYVNSPSGDGAAPFQRATNTVIPYGCSARDSVANVGGTTVFLDHNRCVRPLVTGPSDPISTSVIESLLQGCTKQQIASAYSFVVEAEGFQVYYLTVPSKFTFGYDFRYREWHRRATNGLDWWAVSDVVLWNGDWIAQDSRNGKHYKLDWHEYPFDGQDELIREWTTGAIQADQNPIFLNEVEFLFGNGGKSFEPVNFPEQPDGPSISGNAPDGVVGEVYTDYAYTVTPGDAAISSVRNFSGQLPPPATLSSAGVIASFTPTTPGTYTFQPRVTDANQLWASVSDTIVIGPPQYDDNWKYKVEPPGSTSDYSDPDYDDSAWSIGPGGFGSWVPPGSSLTIGTSIPNEFLQSVWIRRELTFGGRYVVDVFHDDGAWLWVNGEPVTLEVVQYFHGRATIDFEVGDVVALKVTDGVPAGSLNIFAGISFTTEGS